MNVFIFPAGTEIGREIWLSLRYVKDINILIGGSQYENHALYYNKNYINLPAVNEPDWLSELQSCVKENNIDYIFPAHDDVVVALANHQHEIEATVLSPDINTCNITRSKTATYKKLGDVVPVPVLYKSLQDIEKWPVFIKPDKGQGSQGAMRIDTPEALKLALENTKDSVICEYLPGEEFTVDCFSDREKGLLFCQARTRERVRNGITMSSTPVMLTGIEEMAQKISAAFTMRGAWFFQVKRSASGVLTLLEVAPRIAGTMALNRARGVNFPLLTIYESQRLDLSLYTLDCDVKISRGLINRYKTNLSYQHVYVDYDDTVIINGQFNISLISFLFQAVNDNKTVNLISRHKGDLIAELKSRRLLSLFDNIFHLKHGESKANYIHHSECIFIDDSFSERMDVQTRLCIPVLDTCMVELLLNE